MKKVVVIGGGLSGMTACYQLSKLGNYQIELVEASDRLGGRVMSVNVEGVEIDVGGFIVAKWYKYFKQLVKELDLEGEYRDFKPVYGFWLVGNKYKKFQTNIIGKGTSFKRIIILILLTIPFAHSYKKRFYTPDGKGETLYKIFRRVFSKRNLIYRYVDSFFTGFTYQTGNKLSYISAIAFLEMMLLKGGMESAGNLLPTSKVVSKLAKALSNNGVNIHLNTQVDSFKKGSVTLANGQEITTDIIVVATPHIKNMPIKTSISKVETTKYYTIIFEVEEELPLNGGSWAGIFAEPLYKNYEISSLVNLSWMTFGKLSDKYLLAYLKSESDEELEEVKLRMILMKELKRYFSDAKIKKIHSITFFQKNMPIVPVKDIKRLRSLQGKDDIYFTGDYLSFPTMETAVYNGMKVAGIINSKS